MPPSTLESMTWKEIRQAYPKGELEDPLYDEESMVIT